MTAPTVTSVSPASGLGGITVNLGGTGDWTTLTAVNFGALPAISFTSTGGATATAVVPSSLTTSAVDITVTTTTDGVGVANPPDDQFTLLAVTPPYVCFFASGFGVQGGGGASGEYAGQLATLGGTSTSVVDSNNVCVLNFDSPATPSYPTDDRVKARSRLEGATLAYLLGQLDGNPPPVVLADLTASTVSFVWL